jgi:hypothetical protein
MVELSTSPESVLRQQRASLLTDIGNAAQATQASVQRTAVGHLSDTAINLRSINTSQTLPFDPARGRNLDIKV